MFLVELSLQQLNGWNSGINAQFGYRNIHNKTVTMVTCVYDVSFEKVPHMTELVSRKNLPTSPREHLTPPPLHVDDRSALCKIKTLG